MLAIAGGKGGCGKTTTALGLALAYRERGARPLVADLDVDMPNLHAAAGTPRTPGIGALDEGRSLTEIVHDSEHTPAVAVLPADTTGSTAPRVDRLADWDGPVLLDCPAGVSPTAVDPLRAADATVLVSTPRRESLEDAAKTAAVARTLDAPPVGCVLTRCRDELPVERLLSCPLLGTVPPVRRSVLSEPRVRDSYSAIITEI